MKGISICFSLFEAFTVIRHGNFIHNLNNKITEKNELNKNFAKSDSEKLIKDFAENPEVKVLNGRFGPYIVADGKNVKIPKDKDPKSLTLEECLKLAESAPEKKGRFAKKAVVTKPAAVAKSTPKKSVAKKPATKSAAGKSGAKKASPKKK